MCPRSLRKWGQGQGSSLGISNSKFLTSMSNCLKSEKDVGKGKMKESQYKINFLVIYRITYDSFYTSSINSSSLISLNILKGVHESKILCIFLEKLFKIFIRFWKKCVTLNIWKPSRQKKGFIPEPASPVILRVSVPETSPRSNNCLWTSIKMAVTYLQADILQAMLLCHMPWIFLPPEISRLFISSWSEGFPGKTGKKNKITLFAYKRKL